MSNMLKCSVDLISVQDFCEYYHYPEDAVAEIISVGRMIMDSPGSWEQFQKAYAILFDEENSGAEAYLSILREIAGELKLNDYIVPLVFYLCAVSDLEQVYAKKQMPGWVCQDSLRDLLYKVRECKTWTGCYGLYNPAWYYEYFRVERFGLGRLQYDVMPYSGKPCRIADREIQPGDHVLRCHIPKCEQSFGKEERMRSYRLAYRFAKKFYPEIFQEKTIPFMCGSWLLFPLNEKILPETSNIVSFMKEFKLVEVLDSPNSTMERIFNRKYEGNPQDMPADSALQKGYRQWLIDGNVTGVGYGVMLFDGESIINN